MTEPEASAADRPEATPAGSTVEAGPMVAEATEATDTGARADAIEPDAHASSAEEVEPAAGPPPELAMEPAPEAAQPMTAGPAAIETAEPVEPPAAAVEPAAEAVEPAELTEPVEPAAAAEPDEPSDAAAGPTDTSEEPAPPAPRRRLRRPSIDRAGVAAAARVGLKVALVVLVASVALGTAAFVAASVYGQYGAVRDTPNSHEWAALTPRFAGQAICTTCHAPQAAAQDASIHVNVSCEDCHGPAGAHSLSEAAARATVLAKPTSAVCLKCHTATAGRPTSFPQVDPAAHYTGGQCLRCHDPHSIVAVRPPEVTHPLAGLPECTTCHSPDGLKKVPAGHEPVADAICLACHGPAADRHITISP